MPNLPGIEKIRSMQTTGSRSMPPNMNQAYIDIFMLRKEKERLQKEGARIDTRRELIVERLRIIEKDLRRLGGQDEKALRLERKEFDWDAKWVKMPKDAKPEELKEKPKKPKIEPQWKMKTIVGRRESPNIPIQEGR